MLLTTENVFTNMLYTTMEGLSAEKPLYFIWISVRLRWQGTGKCLWSWTLPVSLHPKVNTQAR